VQQKAEMNGEEVVNLGSIKSSSI